MIVSSSASTSGSGDRVALDTSVAIDVLAAKADARLLAGVNEHLLPAPVVGELRYGALNSRKAAENLAKVEALVTRCAVLNVTVATAKVYAELRLARIGFGADRFETPPLQIVDGIVAVPRPRGRLPAAVREPEDR